jgi:peroxiredoxin-like protein
MEKTYRYTCTSHWTTHKRGIVEAENIPRTINFAAPPEFGGEPGLWTPEQLLLAAVATCFTATFRAVAERSKVEFYGLEVPVEGVLEREEGGYRFTQVYLRPALTLGREEDREKALRLLEKAEKACLISRSLASKIIVEPQIVVAPATVAVGMR